MNGIESMFKLGFKTALEICKLMAKKEKIKTRKAAINKTISFVENKIDVDNLFNEALKEIMKGE